MYCKSIKLIKQITTSFCYTIRGGDILPVSKDKTRISVTLTREEYEKLKNKAKEDGRSVSNLIGQLIKQYLRS